jgi:hypothetical protein
VTLESSGLELALCRMASQVLLGVNWSDDDTEITRWMRTTGEPPRRAEAAARELYGDEAICVDAWVKRCKALLESRHRIVHGVFGYNFFGRLVFAFGRRDTPEVLDVMSHEALADDLCLASSNIPIPD